MNKYGHKHKWKVLGNFRFIEDIVLLHETLMRERERERDLVLALRMKTNKIAFTRFSLISNYNLLS